MVAAVKEEKPLGDKTNPGTIISSEILVAYTAATIY